MSYYDHASLMVQELKSVKNQNLRKSWELERDFAQENYNKRKINALSLDRKRVSANYQTSPVTR